MDPRVIGIVPIVMDELNFIQNIKVILILASHWSRHVILSSDWSSHAILSSDWSRHAILTSDWSQHHYMSYGGWSFALEDYWVLNLTLYFDDPKMQLLFDIVDGL